MYNSLKFNFSDFISDYAIFTKNQRNMFKISLLGLLLTSFSFFSFADELKCDTTKDTKNLLILEYQWLRSTHSTKFKGINLIYANQFSKNQSLGLGLEYSRSGFHADNGYNLYNLSFVPIFLDYRHLFLVDHRINIFSFAEAGYSFAKYIREEIDNPSNRKTIREGGIYLNGGIGLNYNLSKHFAPNVSIGFKGFHNSFNNLDIDPHGLVLRFGFNLRN